jgi:hypothetical protein
MGSFGIYLILFGVGSAILSFFDYEFQLLMWVDAWGDGVAWLIRGALILIGMALMSRAARRPQQPPRAQAEHPLPSQQGPVR